MRVCQSKDKNKKMKKRLAASKEKSNKANSGSRINSARRFRRFQ
jgi:hypothetical protein